MSPRTIAVMPCSGTMTSLLVRAPKLDDEAPSRIVTKTIVSADAMAAFRLSNVVLRAIMVHGSAWLSRSHGYARQEPLASALAGGSDGTSWLSVAASWLLG